MVKYLKFGTFCTCTLLMISVSISLLAGRKAQAQPVEQKQRREVFREAIKLRLRQFRETGENSWQKRHSGLEAAPPSASSNSTVKVFDSTLKSMRANKELPYKLSVPFKNGPCPVVVLSHGAGGSCDSNHNLVESWVNAGFACIQPLHADSVMYKRSLGQSASLKDSMNDANDPQKWSARVQDIKDIIDSLDSINQLCPWIQFDKNRIGLAGHSFGAFTAQLLAGVTPPKRSHAASFKDPRVKAVLLLSPQGVSRGGALGFDDASAWRGLNMPVMVMTGSLDNGMAGETPDWRLEPFKYCPAGSKFLVFFNNANHMTFAGSGNSSASSDLMKKRIAGGVDTSYLFPHIEKESSLFFRAFLGADDAALKNLVPERFSRSIGYLETK
jgi:predicted dienelactone hydrolase